MHRIWSRSPLLWATILSLLIGVFLRLQFFGQIPVSLYWDEMAIWNEAQSVAHTGLDTLGRPWNQALYISYGDYKMPAYIWLSSLVARLVSDPLSGARMVSLLSGMSLLLSLPWLAWGLERRFLSVSDDARIDFLLSTALVTALAPVALHFSRVGFESHLGLALLVLSLATLLEGLNRDKLWLRAALGVVSVLLGALSTYAYFSVRFVWPGVFLAVVVGSGLQSLRSSTRGWKLLHGAGAVLGLFLWLGLLLPLFQADFAQQSAQFRLSTPSILNDETTRHRVNQQRFLTGNTLVSRLIFSQRAEQAKQVWQNALQFTTPEYLFAQGDDHWRHGTRQTGVLWWWMAPLLGVGVLALWRRSAILGGILTLWWALGVLPAAVPLDVPHTLRSLNALPPLLLGSAFGLVALSAWIRSRRGVWRFWAAGVSSVLLLGVVILSGVQWSGIQAWYAQESALEWQAGYRELAQYLNQVQQQYEQIQVGSFDERFFVYYQAESGLEWSSLQAIPTSGFKRQTFGNITLEVPDPWLTALPGSLVILSADAVIPPGSVVVERVSTPLGEEAFVAVEIPKN